MRLTHIERELSDIRRTLEEVARRRSAAREVQDLRRRITAIEQHLGIDKQIAA